MTPTVLQTRDAFTEWLRGRAAGEYRGSLNDIITTQDGHYDLKTVITTLWDCKDALPEASCAQAHVPAGSTFAYAVRAERQWMDRRR